MMMMMMMMMMMFIVLFQKQTENLCQVIELTGSQPRASD